jgi:hypothetical protein
MWDEVPFDPKAVGELKLSSMDFPFSGRLYLAAYHWTLKFLA